MTDESPDTRIVYGAMCTWWDDVQNVGRVPIIGLPCCPHCQGVLFEMASEEAFLKLAQEHEAAGNPGYVGFIKWAKGKCFKSITQARDVYRRMN